MGLCKCIQKKVTNQFCFEHRVNVCENCMVEDHPQCIIQSYLRWLNDSDYNPVCQLCQQKLDTSECVRFVCYDVFHKTCLDEWASKLPANTAPAGYRCPICSSGIFPASNLVSPVADALREFLATCEWAKTGLGSPTAKNSAFNFSSKLEDTESQPTSVPHNIVSDRGIPDGHDTHPNTPLLDSTASDSPFGSSQQRHLGGGGSAARRESESSSIYINDRDTDDKYSRRPFAEWMNRLIRTFQRPSIRHHQAFISYGRKSGLFITLVVVIVIVMFLSYLGRRGYDDDPMFDPLNNPNIHVEDSN